MWWEVTGRDTQHRDPPGPADTRPLQSWSCAELRRGFGARRSKFKSKFKSYLCHLFCCVTLSKSQACVDTSSSDNGTEAAAAQAAVRIDTVRLPGPEGGCHTAWCRPAEASLGPQPEYSPRLYVGFQTFPFLCLKIRVGNLKMKSSRSRAGQCLWAAWSHPDVFCEFLRSPKPACKSSAGVITESKRTPRQQRVCKPVPADAGPLRQRFLCGEGRCLPGAGTSLLLSLEPRAEAWASLRASLGPVG